MNYRKEFLQAMRDGNAYGFIWGNYQDMDKEILRDIALEGIYYAEQENNDKPVEDIIGCLEEIWGYDLGNKTMINLWKYDLEKCKLKQVKSSGNIRQLKQN